MKIITAIKTHKAAITTVFFIILALSAAKTSPAFAVVIILHITIVYNWRLIVRIMNENHTEERN